MACTFAGRLLNDRRITRAGRLWFRGSLL